MMILVIGWGGTDNMFGGWFMILSAGGVDSRTGMWGC